MPPFPTSLQQLEWRQKNFAELHPLELYKILQLRNAVFVVEQNCTYQDCDDKDQSALHIMAWAEELPAAYARLLAPRIAYPDASAIGRVLVASAWRGLGLGAVLMERCIAIAEQLYPAFPIRLSAQYHLQQFYTAFYFAAVGDPYLEDGIPHIAMVRENRTS